MEIIHLTMLALTPIVLGLVQLASAMPPLTLQDLEVADDTASVGSYIREVRAAAPQDYYKSYENEGDGDIGYSRKKTGGGKKGYQHFDSYHKKAGDNYEFEKQDSFGHDDGGEEGAHSHRHEQREKYRQPRQKKRDAERITPSRYETEVEEELARIYDEATTDKPKNNKNSKNGEESKEAEVSHEEFKEGASDGNGGVEAYGHDKADYKLPEKYTYGSNEEYNF